MPEQTRRLLEDNERRIALLWRDLRTMHLYELDSGDVEASIAELERQQTEYRVRLVRLTSHR
jgi:hypothetical protein